jgi:tetratricopeptide (TPR) repeat protein
MDKKLIPISAKDVETFRLAAILKQSKGDKEKRDKMKQKLFLFYTDNPGSIEAALSYAAYNIILDKNDSHFDRQEATEDAVAAFQRVLELEENHWLARYYRLMLRYLLTEYYGGGDPLVEEIKRLIHMQNQVPHEPYFILPYVLIAKVLYDLERQQEALEYIAIAEKFPVEPVKELPGFLAYFFNEFETRMRVIEENSLAGRVKKLGQGYFPKFISRDD